jgi:hypothetical protein
VVNAVTPARLRHRLLARKRLEAPVRIFLALTTLLLLSATVLHRDDADGFQASHLFFMPRHTWEMDHGRGMMYEEAYYERMDLEVLAEEVYGRHTEREYEPEERAPIDRTGPANPASTSTAAYRDWLAAQRESYTAWFAEYKGAYADWLTTEAATFDDWLAAQPGDFRATYELELASIAEPTDDARETEETADSLTRGGYTQGQTVRRAPHAPASGGTNLPIIGAITDLDAPGYQFEPVRLPEQSPLSREDDTPYPPPRDPYSV